MSYYPEFAKLLNQHITEQDRSASWLARRLKVNPYTVTRWLNDAARPGSSNRVIQIADILGIHDAYERQALLEGAGYQVNLINDVTKPKNSLILSTNGGNKEPSALIIKVEPMVQVIPTETNRMQAAKFGMYLQHGDRVITFEKGKVHIVCQNGVLISLSENRSLTVDGSPDVEERIEFSPIFKVSLAEALNVTNEMRSLNSTRSSRRLKEAKMPFVLNTCNTSIAKSRATLHWQPAFGTSGVRIQLFMPPDKVSLREPNETYLYLPHPDNEPAFSCSDKQYIVILMAP